MLSIQKLNKGLLNLPGASSSSISLLQELLYKDYQHHHCFWNQSGLHNHLSHHLLSAHDLGAPASLLQTIYDNEVGMQQPLRKVATEDSTTEALTPLNWTTRIGKAECYADYLDFFSSQIAVIGVTQVMREYVFAASANGNGTMMLIRLVSGLMHPFIQLGVRFKYSLSCYPQNLTPVTTFASTGSSLDKILWSLKVWPKRRSHLRVPFRSLICHRRCPPSLTPPTSLSLLELLHEAYESPLLIPVMPYDSEALMIKRLRDWLSDPKRAAEIRRIYAKWTIDLEGGDEEIGRKVRECIVQATLLLASTGKPGRELRADFFLMHYLTGALFLPTVIKSLDSMTAKAQLLQSYARVAALVLMLRGRPRINVPLLMSYTDFPRAPLPATADVSAFGNPDVAEDSNAWLAIVKNALHHPEPHVCKAIRALYYAAQQYGHAGPGDLVPSVDASGAEIHLGLAQLDGTVFVRAAGFISNALGWVIAGQTGVDWDRSALGWEEAWASSD
ncbi:hypothetical protein C8R46DRAFT_392521 [Mycena filopes]|nr:hypothetical protein C8R46DRAFT_392521 [Mycena filopes]